MEVAAETRQPESIIIWRGCPAPHSKGGRERLRDSSSRRRDPTIIRVLRKYLDTAGPPSRGVSVIAASKTDAKVPPTFEPKSEVGN